MNPRPPDDRLDKTVLPQGDAGMPSARAAASLLGSVQPVEAEPIDALLDALDAGASAQTLLDGWAEDGAWPAGVWRRVLSGEASLDEIRGLKSRAKQAYAEQADPAAQHAALLAYLLTSAAALEHHGELISSLAPEVLQEWLVAVAGASGGPVAALFNAAAGRGESG